MKFITKGNYTCLKEAQLAHPPEVRGYLREDLRKGMLFRGYILFENDQELATFERSLSRGEGGKSGD